MSFGQILISVAAGFVAAFLYHVYSKGIAPLYHKRKLQKKEGFKETAVGSEINELWKAIDTIFNRLDFLREVLSKKGVINPFEYDKWDRDLSICGVDDRDSLRIHVIMPDEQHKYWDEWAKNHHVKIVSEKEKEDA